METILFDLLSFGLLYMNMYTVKEDTVIAEKIAAQDAL